MTRMQLVRGRREVGDTVQTRRSPQDPQGDCAFRSGSRALPAMPYSTNCPTHTLGIPESELYLFGEARCPVISITPP